MDDDAHPGGQTRARNDERPLRFADLFNAAGALTLARIPLAFVTAFTMHDRRALIGVFVLAMLTDVLDGPVARATGTQSRAGAVADGWADKIFLINYAWTMRMLEFVEPWHMVAWFLREILQGAWVPLVALDYAAAKAPAPEPHPAGKVATVAIALAMMSALLEIHIARDILTVLGGGAGLWAALSYLRRDRPWKRFTGGT